MLEMKPVFISLGYIYFCVQYAVFQSKLPDSFINVCAVLKIVHTEIYSSNLIFFIDCQNDQQICF